ncbi:MAG: hypothetical protein R6U35_00530 [Candidatus Humimicrobiaceae bacterium]
MVNKGEKYSKLYFIVIISNYRSRLMFLEKELLEREEQKRDNFLSGSFGHNP